MEKLSTKKKLEITVNALMQLIEPVGKYSLDRLEHAQNCIKETSEVAKCALIKIGIKDCRLCANSICRGSYMEKDCYDDLANFEPITNCSDNE